MVIFMSGVFYFYSYFVSQVPVCCRHVLVIVSLLKKRGHELDIKSKCSSCDELVITTTEVGSRKYPKARECCTCFFMSLSVII